MDDATRWAKRAFFLAVIFGILQTAVALATWLNWQPKWSVPSVPPIQFFLSGLCLLSIALTWLALKRQKPAATLEKEELAEIYADVILAWLKQNCHTVCTFATEHMAVNVALPIEKTALGLQRLQKHELIVKKPLFWEYSAASASSILPGYKRLVGRTPVLHGNDTALRPNTETAAQLFGAAQRQAEVLGALPVYLDDLQVKLLCVCHGTTPYDVPTDTTFFLKLSMMSDSDTGFRDLKIAFVIDTAEYCGTPLEDVSEWLIKNRVTTPTYPYANTEEHPLNESSLWRDVRSNGLKSGPVKEGWIGVHIPVSTIGALERLTKVRIETTTTQHRKPYRFTFAEFKRCEETIFHIAFRES